MLYPLRLVTPPEPILTLEEAKEHLRVEHSDDDKTITSLIEAATEDVESEIGRALGVQTLDWIIDPWTVPTTALVLPRAPLISVESINYLDENGDEQTIDPTDYKVSGVGGEGRVTLKSTATWPTVGEYPEPMTIRFVAGYADETVPARAIAAIKLRTAQLYSGRGEMVDGRFIIDPSISNLLSRLRELFA